MKLTPEIKEQIRDLSSKGLSQSAVAREVGCSQSGVRSVLSPEAVRKSKEKYNRSEKGLEACRRYALRNPKKKKESALRYAHSSKGIEKREGYYHSREGKAKRLRHLEETKESRRLYDQEYRRLNKAYFAEKNARRRASQIRATPSWLTSDDLEVMRAIYSKAQELSRETGVIHHVDHIIPLQGKKVCGLHCPSNLQILTDQENTSKGNKF